MSDAIRSAVPSGLVHLGRGSPALKRRAIVTYPSGIRPSRIFQTRSGAGTYQISHGEKFDFWLVQCHGRDELGNQEENFSHGLNTDGTRITGGRASPRDPNLAWVAADPERWGLARTLALPNIDRP